jgi:3-methyladenine DNA glycosylase AlkD
VDLTAKGFIGDLERLGADPPMRDLFALAKTYQAADPVEIRSLLRHADENVRLGGVCIMDFQARDRKAPAQRRRELYDLYMDNHDRIDHWSMVDRAAPYVVGGYLWDKPRQPLYDLAISPRPMERRTAIVATYYFIRQHDLEDTFAIGQILAHDPDELVQKAVGGWVREAGKQDVDRLRAWLGRNAATMPRTALRYAIEHLDADERRRYMDMKA